MTSPTAIVRLFASLAMCAAACAANAAAPVAEGKRALLTLKIEIDGTGQRASRSDGVDVKWSTHRTLAAKVELVAERAQGTSAAQAATATVAGPSPELAALQKEAEKCKSDDTACQMAIAMKMMQSDYGKKMMAQDEAAQAAPPRYQTWEAPKGGRIEAKGEYLEQWDGVFLTASREVRNCKSAFSGAAITPKESETMKSGLSGLNVEVDTQTGKSSLLLVVGSFVASEMKCHINDGGRVFEERDNKSLSFAPPYDSLPTGGWVAGGVVATPAISRGEMSYVTKSDAQSITGMMSVTAPLKVKIRWELVPL